MNQKEKLTEATVLALQGKLVEEDEHLSEQDLNQLSKDLKGLADKWGYDPDQIRDQLDNTFHETWHELFGKDSITTSEQTQQLIYTGLDKFFDENTDISSNKDAIQWIYDNYNNYSSKYIRMYLRNRFGDM